MVQCIGKIKAISQRINGLLHPQAIFDFDVGQCLQVVVMDSYS